MALDASTGARTRRTPQRLAARAALLALGIASLLLACSASPKKDGALCKPGGYVFCRCRDRQEGEKLCADDGKSFGPCEPCETLDNPEGPLDPDDPGPNDPRPKRDAGPDPSCGDGIVQRGEDCDDEGAGGEDDGCASCELSGTTPAASNTCPGLDVHVWGGAHAPALSSTTVGSGNRSVLKACPNAGGKGTVAPDRVFRVTAHAAGTLTVATTDADYDVFLYAAEACGPGPIDWAACANGVDGIGDETLKLPVKAGETRYVFIDGLGTSSYAGSFRVTFSIQ